MAFWRHKFLPHVSCHLAEFRRFYTLHYTPQNMQSRSKHTYAQPATQVQHIRPAAPLHCALQVAQVMTPSLGRAMSTTEPASCCWPSCSNIRCCYRCCCCYCCCICDDGPKSLHLHPQMPRHLLPWHEGPSRLYTLPADQVHATAPWGHVLAQGAVGVAAAAAPSVLLGFSPAA